MMNGTTHHPYHWLHPILGPPTFSEFFLFEFSGVTLFVCAAEMAGARSFSKRAFLAIFLLKYFSSRMPLFAASPPPSHPHRTGITEILELGFNGVFGVCGDGVTGGASVGMSSLMHLTVIPSKNDSNCGNGKLERCAMSTSTRSLGLVTCKIREIRSSKISLSSSTLAHFCKSIVTSKCPPCFRKKALILLVVV